MKYRLALDMGTNSIGWSIFRLHKKAPRELIRIGSRIFPEGRDPKNQESLGAKRRIPRRQRRHRDRYLQRRTNLLNCLQQHGLFPPLGTPEARSLQSLNPYELRTDGLDAPLTPHQLGRVLFHLNQRRGFKSNRKSDAKDQESGKIKQAIKAMQSQLCTKSDSDTTERKVTIGAILYERLKNGEGTRARLQGSGSKAQYVLYADRDMIEAEFEALWEKQQLYHPTLLTQPAHDKIHNIIFYQRPLQPQSVGHCMLEPERERAPKALSTAQRFRLYQEVNHLRLSHLHTDEETSLNQEQRDKLVNHLEKCNTTTYVKLRKKLFGDNDVFYSFTIENSSIARKNVPGNKTNYQLSSKKAFGKSWYQFTQEIQDKIVTLILNADSNTVLIKQLQAEYRLDTTAATHIAEKVKLDSGHFRLSKQAIKKILPYLESWNEEKDRPYTYDQAVRAAGYIDHRIPDAKELSDELPYYGEILTRHCQNIQTATNPDEEKYGRITNPTVHIGLNQLRQVVNTIMRRYGKPEEIHIELARELKLSREHKKERNAENARNRIYNEKLNQRLIELNQKPNAINRLKLKLFNELDKTKPSCIYSGKTICFSKLFTNAYQIDHILPFSKTLDDSYNNKILVTQEANALKGNQSVYELCQRIPSDDYDWEKIQTRITKLPHNKRKRFTPDALQEWLNSTGEFEKDGANFIQRQLTDTTYFSRATREYLQKICPGNKIVSSPGRLTAMLRAKWGLNQVLSKDQKKNRHDHRHHAIDAIVIGLIDRRLLNDVAKLAGQHRDHSAENLLRGVHEKLPFPNLIPQTRQAIKNCTVSHKPDHNPQAQLHEDTAYGMVKVLDAEKNLYLTRHRVALADLKRKEFSMLENTRLATLLKNMTEEFSDIEIKQTLAKLAPPNWPRKAYLLRKISGVSIKLKGTAISPKPEKFIENPVKIYRSGGNYCYEIYCTSDGKWEGDIIRTFDANQATYQTFMNDRKRFCTETFRGKLLIMRLINNDMIAIQKSGQRKIMRIQKMSEGIICLCEHYEANVDARNRDTQDSFSYIYKSPEALRKISARKITVSLLGQVRDPGFKA
ncbi:MAG: type II CRISPR RNA-guided endonuclease Cas9 [Pseudomonadota bacterium]